jgi:release factor glutamine methyltransferase
LTVAATLPTVGAALADAEQRLAAAGVETPRVDAEWLLAGILDVGRNALAVNVMRPLPEMTAARYADAVRRRTGREPLQRILGWEEFRGLRFRLTGDVLIPRPETETLVEWALALVTPAPGRRLRVADVGTGSGCIACALAAARGDLDVVAFDVSASAAHVARDNARALGRAVAVVVTDLLASVRGGSLDAIVANPPYMAEWQASSLAPEVARHEPPVALRGGTDGLAVIERLLDDAPRVLRAGGVIVLETGGRGHVDAVTRRLGALGFVDVAARADLAGIVRFAAGRLPGSARP